MAKISQLPDAALTETHYFPVVDDALVVTDPANANKKSTIAALRARLHNSPAFSGTPTAPTPATDDNTTKIATTALAQAKVDAAIAALRAGAPGDLDTLDKLAAALGDDANFAATVSAALALKAPLASPALSGAPTAPTPATDDNTTRIATTAMVQAKVAAAIAALLNGAPANYDTLQEIAAWIANDETAEAAILAAVALRLRVDAAQGLTETQQAQARSNISVAPVIVSAAPKVITVNPGLLISQENGDNSGTTTGFHAGDQWQLDRTNLVQATSLQRQAETAEAGLKHRLRLSVSVETTAAGARGTIRQNVEGIRTRELGWKAGGGVATCALLARSSVTAVKSLSFRRADLNLSFIREIAFTADQIAFDTFLLPVPGANANWGDGTANALTVDLVARAGSSYVAASAGQWVAGDKIAGPNHQNADASAATLDLLALVMLPGIVPIRREDMPYLVRRDDQELAICWRYYEPFGGDANGTVYNATTAPMTASYQPGKRIAPGIGLYGSAANQIAEVGFGAHTVTALGTTLANVNGAYVTATVGGATLTAGRVVMVYIATPWLAANAR